MTGGEGLLLWNWSEFEVVQVSVKVDVVWVFEPEGGMR